MSKLAVLRTGPSIRVRAASHAATRHGGSGSPVRHGSFSRGALHAIRQGHRPTRSPWTTHPPVGPRSTAASASRCVTSRQAYSASNACATTSPKATHGVTASPAPAPASSYRQTTGIAAGRLKFTPRHPATGNVTDCFPYPGMQLIPDAADLLSRSRKCSELGRQPMPAGCPSFARRVGVSLDAAAPSMQSRVRDLLPALGTRTDPEGP